MSAHARDFSTISPSARSLLLMKSQTSIPFAAEAARLVFGAEGLEAALADMKRQPISGLRVQHFENRYRSLDTLLADTGLSRILELGAGFSLRGLDWARRDGQGVYHYLDTDLPVIVAPKLALIAALQPVPVGGGRLETLPLDALDPAAFRAAAARLAPGPVAIINEGLLMYLDDAEKQRLAANVRDTLREHGGVWITADVYVRTATAPSRPLLSASAQAFLDQHRVETNKFSDWQSAERFFADQGFVIDCRLPPPDASHIRESWVLALPKGCPLVGPAAKGSRQS